MQTQQSPRLQLPGDQISSRQVSILTESYSYGGLETHIESELRTLHALGLTVHMLVGSSARPLRPELQPSTLSVGLPINARMTVGQLLECVDFMRSHLRLTKPRLFHVHPSISIIPGFLAATLESIPVAITLHGPNNLSPSYGDVYRYFLQACIFPSNTTIFVISEELRNILLTNSPTVKTQIIPNPVRPPSPTERGIVPTVDRILFLGRIDQEKLPGFLDFVRKAFEAGLPPIDVFADKLSIPQLRKLLADSGLSSYVSLNHWTHDARAEILRYKWTAGMGRSIIEALALSRPSILVGYDGLNGLMLPEKVQAAAFANYSGRNLPTISGAQLKSELNSISPDDIAQMATFVLNRHDENVVWNQFIEKASNNIVPNRDAVLAFLRSIASSPSSLNSPVLSTDTWIRICSGIETSTTSPRGDHSRAIYEKGVGTGQRLHDSDAAIMTDGQSSAFQEHSRLTFPEHNHARRFDSSEIPSAARPRKSASIIFRHTENHLNTLLHYVRSFLAIQRQQGLAIALREASVYLLRLLFPQAIRPGRSPVPAMEYESARRLLQYQILLANNDNTTTLERAVEQSLDSVLKHNEKCLLIIFSDFDSLWAPYTLEQELLALPEGVGAILLRISTGQPYAVIPSPRIVETNSVPSVLRVLRDVQPIVTAYTPLAAPIVRHIQAHSVFYVHNSGTPHSSLASAVVMGDHQYLIERQNRVVDRAGDKGQRSGHPMGRMPCHYARIEPLTQLLPLPPKATDSAARIGSPIFKHAVCAVLDERLNWASLRETIRNDRYGILFLGHQPAAIPLVREQSLPNIAQTLLKDSRNCVVRPTLALSIKCYCSLCLTPLPLLSEALTGRGRKARPTEIPPGFEPAGPDSSALVPAFCPSSLFQHDDIHDGIRGHAEAGVSWQAYESCPENSKPGFLSGFMERQPAVGIIGRRRRAAIITVGFFDWQGERCYNGGAERYVVDLANVLVDMGFSPEILQCANRAFVKRYRGHVVRGIQYSGKHNFNKMSMTFRAVCQDCDLVIASPLELAQSIDARFIVGINHGIHWDHRGNVKGGAVDSVVRDILSSVEKCNLSVAVDTNFINWLRTVDYNLASRVHFIPNYVDTREFSCAEKDFSGGLVCVYPRRLYEARGLYVAARAFDTILSRYSDVGVRFVGQADTQGDAEVVLELLRRHGQAVRWEEQLPDEMPKVYRSSHIVVIPTMYSEGTSLSCLEAMASRCCVIASNVGGLPNLVINEFNGLLISPDAADLVFAFERLYRDRALLERLASRARETSVAFDISVWRGRWLSVLEEFAQ